MNKTLLSTIVGLTVGSLLSAAEPAAEKFEEIRTRARQMGETEEGKAYEKRFSEAFAQPMQAALRECVKDMESQYLVHVVFVIGADGLTQRIVAAPNEVVSACVAKKLAGLQLPAPPKPDWMVSVNISVKE